MTEKLPLCECGKCGLRVAKKGNRFINGHHRRGKHNSPKACAKMSAAKLGKPRNSPAQIAADKATSERMQGIPHSPERCDAISAAKLGVLHSSEHNAAIKKGLEDSGIYEVMRGGNDICDHHYIYDHDDLSLNTVQITRSDHTSLHNILRGLGYIIPHINESQNL